MVPAKETAEEQLLRMIEGPSGPRPTRQRSSRFSFTRVTDALRSGMGGARQWVWGGQSHRERADVFLWQLRLASRALWGVLVLLAVYLLVDLWMLQPRAPRMVTAPERPETSAGLLSESLPEERLKQAAAYRQTLASRNPFRLAPTKSEDAPAAKTVKSKLADLVSSLTVVGINRGTVPEALIEDTQAKRTHFVKVGDQVNGVTISSISSEGVKVTYEGEEAILQ